MPSSRALRILILGAGPTGLGAAHRLEELGHASWRLIDQAPEPGGLASSVYDPAGFTWDLGGHVLFSHFEYFDRLMDELLPGQWVEHIREAWVWMRQRFIPYPLQNNIWLLPPEDLVPCVKGLLEVTVAAARNGGAGAGQESRAADFHEWILASFGRGLADVFMLPYNFKVWAHPPQEMSAQWMGERVARVDLGRVLENMILRRQDTSWGPNAKFRFPLRGGTGAIWRALHVCFPAARMTLGRRVVTVDAARRVATLDDGEAVEYDRLISTIPLDRLLISLTGHPDLSACAAEFRHSSSHIVGVGLDGPVPPEFSSKCWIYFPETDTPFYRATIFSNYSPHNVPLPGQQWSVMCEVSESTPHKPVDAGAVAEDCVAGLRRASIIPGDARVLSLWHRRLEYGYPTPFLGRDRVLEDIDPVLRELGIWSRGRFGAWKYEVSNQDHSMMQGVEAADHLLYGTEETTYHRPAVVNASKQPLRPVPKRS